MNFILRPCIDVSTWPVYQRQDSAPYAHGARDKTLLHSPADVQAPWLPNHFYLFKLSDRRYPQQFWMEVIASLLGDVLPLEVQNSFPAYRDGVSASLIEFFVYPDERNRLMQGGELMEKAILDYDFEKGTQHNLEDVLTQLTKLHKQRLVEDEFKESFFSLLLFDALIGNSDRHHDNWGILLHRIGHDQIGQLSPAFDNGTSMGREIVPQKLKNYAHVNDLDRYIDKGCHHLRLRRDSEKQLGHLEFIKWCKQHESAVAARFRDWLPSDAQLETLTDFLTQHYSQPEVPLIALDNERISFTMRLLRRRLHRIQELLP